MSTYAMISAAEHAVYNSPIAEMRIPSSGCRSCVHSLLFLLCTCWASAGYAADWNSPAEELARKIALVAGAENVALSLTNLSSLSAKEMQDVDRDLRLQLASSGVHTVSAEQAATTLDVTLSENTKGYLWVAVLHRRQTEPAVVMVPVARPDTSVPVQDLPPMSLRKTLLWTQEQPMLDVLLMEQTNLVRMMVLDAENVAIYRATNGHWQKEQSLALAHSLPWPRDLRGRLVLRTDHGIDAYLPGVICQISATFNSVVCRDSSDPWPLSSQLALTGFFAPSRNFFTGVLTPGIGRQTSISKFYSAASVPRQNSTLWVIATIDGTVHVLDGTSEQTASVHWGSDIASVSSSCGSGWQILATQPGAPPTDAVRAFEMPEPNPVPVSAGSDFAGPISALWTEANGASAVAVSKNAATGSYEAYRVAVACGQ
jgi:hypothetical protein